MRVLVAEDEEILAELVATGLGRAGFAVDTVYSGDTALACLGPHDDVVVPDRDLPRVHGDDVARRLVSAGSRTEEATRPTAVAERAAFAWIHGGTATAEPRPGGGLAVTVRLRPISPA